LFVFFLGIEVPVVCSQSSVVRRLLSAILKFGAKLRKNERNAKEKLVFLPNDSNFGKAKVTKKSVMKDEFWRINAE